MTPMSMRMFKEPAMLLFLIHLIAFVVIVGAFIAFNLIIAPQHVWVIWVLAGWGIALAAHDIALLLRKTHRRERIFIDPKARAFVVHAFMYAAVILLLFVVNWTETPKVWWFYWVALGWGAGVAFEGWCTFYKHRRRRAAVTAAPQAVSTASHPAATSKSKPARHGAARHPRPKPRG